VQTFYITYTMFKNVRGTYTTETEKNWREDNMESYRKVWQ